MADDDEGQEKTEEPSERRKTDAIKEGRILTSKELLLAAVMLGGVLQLTMGGRYYFNEMSGLFRSGLDISDVLHGDIPLIAVVGERFAGALMPLAIFGIPLILNLVVAQMALGGLHFIPQNLSFKGNRLSPLSGLSRMFGPSSIIELVKSILKIVLVGVMGVSYLVYQLPAIMGLAELPFEAALTASGSIVLKTFLVLVAGAALIAAVDVLYQWNKHKSQMMMTKQELRDESKESDGSPEVKQKIRQMQREAADRGSVANISQAQVIITNPSHFAIGLRYDFVEGTAPKVVVKGTDAVAQQIREKAGEMKLPVLEYPLLARALYFTSEVGSEIHSELYRAVAAILTFVYHTGDDAVRPDIDVPPELRFDSNGKALEKRNV